MQLCRILGTEHPRVTKREKDFNPVGLEIEYERALEHDPVQGWSVHADGSLRNNGIEYVFSSPVLTRRGADIRIRRLTNYAVNQRYATSIRTGIHVHVNMQDVGHTSLRNILLAYILAEPALYAYCGEERHMNPYCIPWFAAAEPAESAMRALHLMDIAGPAGDMSRASHLFRNTNKYAGLYLGPLTSFGTIEFRHLPTTLDADIIMHWLDMVQQVVAYGTHNDLTAQLQTMDAEDMVESMLVNVPLLRPHTGMYEEADVPGIITRVAQWCTAEVPVTSWVMVKDKPRQERAPKKKTIRGRDLFRYDFPNEVAVHRWDERHPVDDILEDVLAGTRTRNNPTEF